ncbi:response regulator [Catalinimonas niigatensis]|uniref:response regulator n=1 Tax=Catalinimonas niigatensis TaxID=1397264 RepID=UPI002666C208|nr:response regulator [Catalinimonas niigatensis]WPP49884.1 response regulator [Catalinimonas niigatensis]
MANFKKVLVAEDSSVIQNLTKKVLQFQNYDIDSVKNGEEVLKAIETNEYDIILMDIGMPKMDGMECTRQIRALADKQKANIPIVAITGNAKNYSEEEFNNAGINEYIQKPINFDHLVEVVKKFTS